MTGAAVVRSAQWGLLLGLLLAAFTAPGVYAVTAGSLLLLNVLAFLGILTPPARVVLSVATTGVFPLCAEAAGAGDAAVLGGLLALPWIHSGLRSVMSVSEASTAQPGTAEAREGAQEPDLQLSPDRSVTPLARALGMSGILIISLGLIAGRGVVAATGAVLLAWLLATIGFVFLRLPSGFIEVKRVQFRAVVGRRSEAATALTPATRLPCYVHLTSPNSWAEVQPGAIRLDSATVLLRLILTPPLAGPEVLRAEAVARDPWGLTGTRQSVDIADLHIIPRAKYAAWLARIYLEQANMGSVIIKTDASRRPALGGGVEFYGARIYAPGDGLRAIDWKHTAKLKKLVVKEFRDAGGQAAIVAVGLEALDAEGADRLSYRLVMTTLTLAQEGIPVVLAGYTRNDVVRVTPLLASREAVREALNFTKYFIRIPSVRRTLAYSSLGRLRRLHRQLTETEAGRRLADLIAMEMRIVIEGAAAHPATRALRVAATRVQRPAAVLTLSTAEDQAPILNVTLERLKALGYRPMSAELAIDGVSPGVRPDSSRLATRRYRSPRTVAGTPG